jgi:hypothetical protein
MTRCVCYHQDRQTGQGSQAIHKRAFLKTQSFRSCTAVGRKYLFLRELRNASQSFAL